MRHATPIDRRQSIPHYKLSQQRANQWAFTFTIALTFIAGCMAGASIAMGVL